MRAEVDFEYKKLGYNSTEEDACLGFVAGRLVAIFISSPRTISRAETPQWYLDTGFGPCDRQGLMFASLEAARMWIQARIYEDAECALFSQL